VEEATGLPPLGVYQKHPNPFNPSTTLRFALPLAGGVRLSIYDIGGRLVRDLVSGLYPAGTHTAVWDGRDAAGRSLASGSSYVARMEAGGKVEAVRMSLV
jgi:flagellar hook assembly protein FlgD